jgi:hypothetical protein
LRRLNARLRAWIKLVAVKRFFTVVAAVIALLLALILPAVAARLVFFVARARIGQHTEIMVAELQIIFGQHPVARLLGIARQRLVFFKKLRRVPARTVIDPVAIVLVPVAARIAALRTLVIVAPAATAPVLLAIVDQDKVVPNKEVKKIPSVPPCVLSYPNRRTISRFAEPRASLSKAGYCWG